MGLEKLPKGHALKSVLPLHMHQLKNGSYLCLCDDSLASQRHGQHTEAEQHSSTELTQQLYDLL